MKPAIYNRRREVVKYPRGLVLCLSTLIFVICMVKAISVAHGDVKITDQWIREMPPGSTTLAAYMTITNVADLDVSIVDVSSQIAEKTQLHQVSVDNDMVKMRHLKNLEIKARQAAIFTPGGNHIMFMGVKKTVKAGDEVALDISFSDGNKEHILIPVQTRSTK